MLSCGTSGWSLGVLCVGEGVGEGRGGEGRGGEGRGGEGRGGEGRRGEGRGGEGRGGEGRRGEGRGGEGRGGEKRGGEGRGERCPHFWGKLISGNTFGTQQRVFNKYRSVFISGMSFKRGSTVERCPHFRGKYM